MDNRTIEQVRDNETLWINKALKLEQENKELKEENGHLKDLYKKTCEHLFNIGNDELARYFQAQILECPVFTPQILGDDKNE